MGKLGSTSTPTRTAPGCNSCNSPRELSPKRRDKEGDTGDVAARPVEAGDEPELTGSPPLAKTIGIVVVAALATIDDGESCAAITVTYGVPDRLRGRAVGRVGPAPSDTRSPHSGPRRSRIHEGLGGMRSIARTIDRRRAAEESDHRHRWLLRPRRERPSRRRATKQRDDLAALQLTKLHPLPLARVTA